MNTELGVATLAYGFTAGVMITLGLVFAMTALWRGRFDATHVTFCCAGLIMGVGAAVTVRLHSSQTVSEYTDLFKVFALVSLLMVITVTSLVAVWTGSVPRVLLVVHAVASVLIGILVVTLPGSLLTGEITALREVSLFGETFVVHDAESSSWRPALDVYLVFTTVLIVTGLVRGRRRAPAEVRVLAIGLAALAAVGVYDSLVDEGIVSTPYLSPFGSLALVFVGSWWLATAAADNERLLREYAHELESAVAERTAELVDANVRLGVEVARQAETMDQLASLTEHFERVNDLVLDATPGGETVGMIQLVLGDLARLVGARRVSLELDDIEPLAMEDPIRWSAAERSADPSGVDAGSAVVEQLTASGRSLGRLVIEVPSPELQPESRRFVELASDHLAGFLERVELVAQIAQTAVAAERERLARELHDSVTQKLYAASFLTDALLAQGEDEGMSPDATVRRLRQVLLSSLAELRALMYEIHPPALASTGLGELLEQLAQGYRIDPDLTIEARVGSSYGLPADAKVGLYRIAQEAVSNAVRHAGSPTVTIELTRCGDGVELVVSDRGGGFDSRAPGGGNGLGNMRMRAALIGASFEVDSAPGCGTVVRVEWRPASNGLEATSARVDRVEGSVS